MQVLSILASPRKETSVSAGIVEAFLSEYQQRASHVVVDTLNVWEESLPDFDAEAIGAKYKGGVWRANVGCRGRDLEKDKRAGWKVPKRRTACHGRSDVELLF